MKKTSVLGSLKPISVLGTVLAGSLVVAGAWPMAGNTLKGHQQNQGGRKSTDPPIAPHGNLGQDLFLAIDHRSLADVQALIKKGADPNCRNGLEFTPLYIAAASHQTNVMDALVKAGAQVEAESTYGTALHFASISANLEGAKLLISKGANVNVARTDGLTPLLLAANAGHPGLVAELLKNKADINAVNNNGTSALALAARNGNLKAGEVLLGAGIEIETVDKEGRTPLMEAAINGHADFVAMLLKKGAKADARDNMGRTALFLASAYGDYPEVLQALKQGGANANPVDAKGRSAAAFAAARGHNDSLGLLGRPTSAAVAAVGQNRSAKQAVTGSLNLLQSSMVKFNEMAGCISCHQEGLGRMATGRAKELGFVLNSALQKEQMGRLNGALNAMRPLHEQALKSPEAMKQVPLIEINEVTPGASWFLAGMAAHKQAADPATSAMAMVLGRQQTPAGNWSYSLPRVPMQSSFFTFTALAVKDLSVYGSKSSAPEIAQRKASALKWLLTAKPATSEDLASRLMGLKWASATAKDVQKAMADVRAGQRPDGGWSQLPTLQSDAYATGQALYALHVAGMPVTDPVYKKGVSFLLRTQDEDGSWFVNKRAIPANNYFDAGFPHGESQYASFNGTCWATLALLETLAPKSGK